MPLSRLVWLRDVPFGLLNEREQIAV